MVSATSTAPEASQMRRTASTVVCASGRSVCTSSIAAASMPMWVCASTAASVVASRSSSIERSMASAESRSTARPASSRSAKVATTVEGGGGAGRRRSVTSVITPSVPSEPTSRLVRS
ncbi:hypothetical protein ASF38_07020 [Aeromicrobium sp. Leaf272]|nr:hypothetical protein ASF38_07020 [Aeromicrobium sp. Leaf272]